MNKLYLGVIALSMLVVTNALSIEDLVTDDTPITIVSVDGKTFKQEYGLLKHSILIEHLVADIQEGGVVKVEIPVPNLLAKDWVDIIGLLKKNKVALRNELEKRNIKQLSHLISNVNYLDIPSVFEPAIEIIADKIKASTQLICNEKSISKVEGAKNLCKDALRIDIPFVIESKIIRAIVPEFETSTQTIPFLQYLVDNNVVTQIFAEQRKEYALDAADNYLLYIKNGKATITIDGQKINIEQDVFSDKSGKKVKWSIKSAKNELIYENTTDTDQLSNSMYRIGDKSELVILSFGKNFEPKAFVIRLKISPIMHTTLEAQIYLKKEQGKNLNKDEQKIYDELMKK